MTTFKDKPRMMLLFEPYYNLFTRTETTPQLLSNLTSYMLDDYTPDGMYKSFTFSPNNIIKLGNEVEDLEFKTWSEALTMLETCKQELINNNVSLNNYKKHFILTTTGVTFFIDPEETYITDFSPITPDETYYQILRNTPNLDPIITRLIIDLTYSKGFTVDESINSYNMPKEWLKSIYFEEI